MSTTNPVAGNQYFTRVTKSTSKDLDLNAANVVGTNVTVGQKYKESFDLITANASTSTAISLTTVTTIVNPSAAASLASLAAGEIGQVKIISVNPATFGSAETLKVTLGGGTLSSFSVATLTASATAAAFITVIYTGSTNGWIITQNSGSSVAAP